MKAVSPTGVSRWSGYAAADTPAAPAQEPAADPADLAPSGLSAALADGGGVALSWNAPARDAGSVSGYEILGAQGAAELSTLTADTGSTATAYVDAGATEPGESYAYRVKAIRGEERSPASNRTAAIIPKVEPQQNSLPANITLDADNYHAGDIWSDGTTIWVADHDDTYLYAYALTPGATYGGRDSDKDIDLADGNDDPKGIWSDGTTMWVVDNGDRKLYAYALTPGESYGNRDSAQEFDLHSDNSRSHGIWSDGTTMWVVDYGDRKLYAYTLTPGASYGNRDSDKEFDLHSDNDLPQGIWSDVTTMWVTDSPDDKLYAYALTPGEGYGDRDSDKDLDLADDNDFPWGIWADGKTMWVMDWEDGELYTYALGARSAPRIPKIELHQGAPLVAALQSALPANIALVTDPDESLTNGDPQGIWSDGTTMWVADDGDGKLYAYALTPGASYGNRDSAQDIDLADDNGKSKGIWSDGRTMWVNDFNARIYAYVLTYRQHLRQPRLGQGHRPGRILLLPGPCVPYVGGGHLVGRNDHVGAGFRRCRQAVRPRADPRRHLRRPRFDQAHRLGRRQFQSLGHLVGRSDHVGGGSR